MGAPRSRSKAGSPSHSTWPSTRPGVAVPPGVAIKPSQPSAKDLLAGLVYPTNGYANNPIDTSSMRLVNNGGTSLTASGARTTTIANGVSVTVSQPDGIYLVVAADASSQ